MKMFERFSSALRLFKWAVSIKGLQKVVDQFANAQTLTEQRRIWDQKLRNVLLGPVMSKLTHNPWVSFECSFKERNSLASIAYSSGMHSVFQSIKPTCFCKRRQPSNTLAIPLIRSRAKLICAPKTTTITSAFKEDTAKIAIPSTCLGRDTKRCELREVG